MTSVSEAVGRRRHRDAEFLATRFLWRHARRRGFRQAYRLALKALLRPNAFASWLAELKKIQRQFDLADNGLHLYVVEPLRPFLRAGLDVDQRLRISLSHHHLLAAAVTPGTLKAIWAGHPTRLCTLQGRRESRYALWLDAAEYVREGSLEIFIARDTENGEAPIALARVSFSLCRTRETGHRRALLIGGLQGCPQAIGKRAIIDATRDLKGMRPKTAVALAAQSFAFHAGCVKILAVSDATHVINLRGAAKREQKSARYDEFWLERGGVADELFGFALPLVESDPRSERQAIISGVGTVFAGAGAPAKIDARPLQARAVPKPGATEMPSAEKAPVSGDGLRRG